MREFHGEGRINFVDKNDVLIGFDDFQGCCENFGWFYDNAIPTEILNSPAPEDLENYVFDPEFFEELTTPSTDCGGIAVFKLLNGEKVLYLCLYNSHNGYYGHGFSVTISGKVVRTGGI